MRWIIPIATGVWAFWRWMEEREQHRIREKNRISALYVNPFLSVCEDIQSRIYNILEVHGLRALRKRYPDHGYADETLYLIVRYFGWVASVLRYGPSTQDPEIVHLIKAIRNDFATTEYPVGPFAFFRPEQKTLGKLVKDCMMCSIQFIAPLSAWNPCSIRPILTIWWKKGAIFSSHSLRIRAKINSQNSGSDLG